jgi:glutamate synthase domain-containing protein 1
MKQFIVVEEDLVDAHNGQINFLKHNNDLIKTEIKNMKQFNLVDCLLATGISFQACSGVLEDVAQES